MRDVRRNKKRFALAHDVIDNAIAFADAHFDVAFELIKILFGIDQMKIVPRVGTFDDHDEKVAAIVEITIAYGRLKEIAVCFDPLVDVDRRQHLGRGAAPNGLWR